MNTIDVITLFKNLLHFDSKYYLNRYPDIASENLNPVLHYIRHGFREGRFPNTNSELNFAYNSETGNLHFGKQIWGYLDESPKSNTSNTQPLSVGVHLHLFYHDLLEEFIHYFNNIPVPFDLYITVAEGTDNELIRQIEKECVSKLNLIQKIEVIPVPNQGRDIAPLICSLGEKLLNYDVIGHFHTKKSLSQNMYTKLFFWRKYLLENLLGSQKLINNIFDFLRTPNAGICFPEPFYGSDYRSVRTTWWNRFPKLIEVLRRVGISRMDSSWVFPVGSMFWGRSDALAPLFMSDLNYNDFPKEDKKLNDGTIAHAIERIFGYLPLSLGRENFVILSPANRIHSSQSLEEAQRKLKQKVFDREYYLKTNPDVAVSGIDPFKHFQNYGVYEKRSPCPNIPLKTVQFFIDKIGLHKDLTSGLDPDFYLSTYFDAFEDYIFGGISPYTHYELIGKIQGYLPNLDKLNQIRTRNSVEKTSFSIVIPVYKSEKFLKTCLDSVFNQTISNFEVILVNDGSPDNSISIIESYQKKYPNKIKLINHETNLGLVKVHIDGINACNGEFFTILDADDYLAPNFLEEMGNIALAYDVSCVACRWTRPTSYQKPTLENNQPLDIRILSQNVKLKAIGNWKGKYPNLHMGLNRKLYRTKDWKKLSPLSGIPGDVFDGEDHIASINFLTKCNDVAIIKNTYYHWFDNRESLSNNLAARTVYGFMTCAELLSYLQKSNDNELREIHYRNLDNMFSTQLLARLASHETNMGNLRTCLEYFATYFDKNINLFSEEQRNTISRKVMDLYYKACKDLPNENFILFVDTLGIANIKNHYLTYFAHKSSLPYKYVQCSSTCSLSDSLHAILLGCTCKLIVTSGGWSRYEFRTNNKPIVQLWHGLGALKNVKPFPKSMVPLCGICSSKAVQEIYCTLFCLPKDKVFPYGSIVTDDYFDENLVSDKKQSFYSKYPSCLNKKIYVYAPTFRRHNTGLAYPSILNWAEIEKNLNDDEVLLVKFHPALKELAINQKPHLPIESKKIIEITDDGDIFQFLCVCEKFITDYSSAFMYALLLNIPVMFLMTDLEEYQKQQGLLIDPESLPGYVCFSQDTKEILKNIREANSENSKYQDFKKFHLEGCDGNSRHNITSLIESVYFHLKN